MVSAGTVGLLRLHGGVGAVEARAVGTRAAKGTAGVRTPLTSV